MCGLVGVIGDIWGKDKRVFEFLLKLDTVRGPHSTGVGRVKVDGTVEVVKGVGTPWHLVNEKPREYYNDHESKYPDELKGAYKVLMGHNRWATMGEINEDNAHPFQQYHITGAHNGTLDNYSLYRLEEMDRFDTDSEGLYYNIALNGLKKAIGKTSGAWMLTWWDSQENTFNMLRNKERPMHYTWNKNGRTLYYASEEWMLEQALNRHGIDRGLIYELPEDMHYKFDLTELKDFTYNSESRTEVKGWTYTPQAPFTTVRGGKNAYTNTSDAPSVEDLKHLIGEYQCFDVSTVFTDEEGKKYVSGWLDNYADIEVRIYCDFNSKLYEALDDQNFHSYYGRVKKVRHGKRGLMYVTMHHDSIVGIGGNDYAYSASKDLDDEIPWDNFVNADLEAEKKEFAKSVEDGCCWCSYVPEYRQKDKCMFMTDGQFLCADCTGNSDVTQYVSRYYR